MPFEIQGREAAVSVAPKMTEKEENELGRWLDEQLARPETYERIAERQAAAKRKNGWWRNFWTEYGPDLLFVVCVLGAVAALTAIYLAVETLGWFDL